MSRPIEAILFDMGGTLRKNIKRDEITRVRITQQILDILESDTSSLEFATLLMGRSRAYEKWASECLVELNEISYWTEWMLPDWPKELIAENAMVFNQIWRDAICTRVMQPDAKETILGLYQNGYRLGLVSNTTSSVDSPITLEKEGIARFLDVVILSCVFGKRKPSPLILMEAAEKIGVLPGHCAYVGDRAEWDLVAARDAGFGKIVIISDTTKSISTSEVRQINADFYINNLIELLEIFPTRQKLIWGK